MKKDTHKRQKGFTLIELLVSLALFSIFIVAVMGAIFTIVDANRKARSLMTVMNNLSFSIDGITRSFKTGDMSHASAGVTPGGDCLTTYQLDYQNAAFNPPNSIPRALITYCFVENNGLGKITRSVNGASPTDYTSPDIDIDHLEFDITSLTPVVDQPKVLINMKGTVKVSENVSSSFTVQTSISQSKLNL